jgi:hypothetical protein
MSSTHQNGHFIKGYMNPTTKIRLLDIRYLFLHKPETYRYYTGKLKERLAIGETVEITLDDTTSFQPVDAGRFEKFLADEIENTVAVKLPPQDMPI